MNDRRHILVIRFSAMGDVAMTVPVIKQVLQQNPGLTITVVSNVALEPLFEHLPNCQFFPAFLKTRHKGVAGIYQLFKELKQAGRYDAVVDLHSVLRSHLLSTLFKLNGTTVVRINKGRYAKKQLTRKKKKVLSPLPAMHLRYADVFVRTGLQAKLDLHALVYSPQPLPKVLDALFASGKQIIGVAPFAQHLEKMYPLLKMREVVRELASSNIIVLLFGGGAAETAELAKWQEAIPGVFSMAGKYALREEMAIISNLALMVSMDSANMHLASLYGIPVISIWGATHPFAGFAGWGQQPENFVQTDLYCRPCSVFGNKPCYRGDHACMHLLSQKNIVDHIRNTLHFKGKLNP